jgi:hypothetical protein
MKIRKFNCPTCGAAKVNPYKTPFVCCDYCGGWIDLDASLWLEIYTEKKKFKLLEELQERILVKTRKAINEKNRELYFRAQQEYFATFYNIYPEFIPPTIGKGEKFKAFLKTKAEWITDLKFDDALGLKKKRAAADRAMQNLQSPKEPHVDFFGTFVDTATTYHKYLKLEAEEKNTNPKFSLLKEIYPDEFEYKMRMALFVNAYLFRLSDLELKHFKNQYGLEYEFVELNQPAFTEVHCNYCQQTFKAPKGAIRCVCEHCLELSTIQRNINCANCGMENSLPEKWNPLINCTGCGTEIRVVSLTH